MHLSITKSSILVLISQIVSFVVGFGVINSIQAGVIISAATAAVNAAFLIANAIHAVANKGVSVNPVPTPPSGH